MSPKAKRAVEAAISGIERYPDQFELIKAVAERCGVAQNQVVLGNGSNDVLDLIARVFLAPGRSAVFAQHAFAVYPLATLSTGAELIATPAKNYGHDLNAMRAAIRPDTRIVWIANPNNPTGNFLPYPEVRAFLEAVPQDVVVVLDEAYNEYLPPAERVDTAAWIADFPNLVVTRTFSKIFGLAGLRVGYALASAEIADLMNRVRQPFNCQQPGDCREPLPRSTTTCSSPKATNSTGAAWSNSSPVSSVSGWNTFRRTATSSPSGRAMARRSTRSF